MEMVECVRYPLLMMIQWIKIYGQIKLYIKQCYCIFWSVEKIQKVKTQKL